MTDIYCEPFDFIRCCPASCRVSPFVGFLKHREQQLARRKEHLDAVCSGYWRGGYEISLEGEEDEVQLQHYERRADIVVT